MASPSAACIAHRCLVPSLVLQAVIRHPTLQVTLNLFFIACLLRNACVFSLVLAHHPSSQNFHSFYLSMSYRPAVLYLLVFVPGRSPNFDPPTPPFFLSLLLSLTRCRETKLMQRSQEVRPSPVISSFGNALTDWRVFTSCLFQL